MKFDTSSAQASDKSSLTRQESAQAIPGISVLAQAGRNGGTPSGNAEKHDVGSQAAETVSVPIAGEFDLLSRDPLDQLRLDNIKPLYTSPGLPGEGVWESSEAPRDARGRPIIYRTFYRPSVAIPERHRVHDGRGYEQDVHAVLRRFTGTGCPCGVFRNRGPAQVTHNGHNKCYVDATPFQRRWARFSAARYSIQWSPVWPPSFFTTTDRPIFKNGTRKFR